MMELFEVLRILGKRIVWLIILPLLVASLTYILVVNKEIYTAKCYFNLSRDGHMTQYILEELKNHELLKAYLSRPGADFFYKKTELDVYVYDVILSVAMTPVTQRKGRHIELEGFDMNVSNKDKDVAYNKLKVFNEYAQHYLAWKKASALLDVRHSKTRQRIVELENEKLAEIMRVDNIDRRLKKLSELTQDKTDEGEQMVVLSGEISSSFLPIKRQISGLKSRRIEHEEQVRVISDRIQILKKEMELIDDLAENTVDKGFALWSIEDMANVGKLMQKMPDPLMNSLLRQSLNEIVNLVKSYYQSIGLGAEGSIIVTTRKPEPMKAAFLTATITLGLLSCWFVLLAAWKRWTTAVRRQQ